MSKKLVIEAKKAKAPKTGFVQPEESQSSEPETKPSSANKAAGPKPPNADPKALLSLLKSLARNPNSVSEVDPALFAQLQQRVERHRERSLKTANTKRTAEEAGMGSRETLSYKRFKESKGLEESQDQGHSWIPKEPGVTVLKQKPREELSPRIFRKRINAVTQAKEPPLLVTRGQRNKIVEDMMHSHSRPETPAATADNRL